MCNILKIKTKDFEGLIDLNKVVAITNYSQYTSLFISGMEDFVFELSQENKDKIFEAFKNIRFEKNYGVIEIDETKKEN